VLPSKQSLLKPQPQSSARMAPKFGPSFDRKRVVQVVAVLAVGVALAIWGISKTFKPGPVTRLERAEPTYVDAGPPAPPKPAEPRRPTPPLTAETARPADAAHEPVAVIPPPRVQPPPPRPPGSVVPVTPIGRAITPAPRDAKLPPPELRFETFENVIDSAIYSANDKDVDPPVVLYPQQLGRVPIGLRRDEVTFVEVTISEEGRVMQVKARESPSTLDESMVLTMSLSAAKTWRFQAARKDGKAVKYRQVLPVSLR
jgi:Gram-negative bacterial TonB protein C-terminal